MCQSSRLSKILSHALRHSPEEYGITLDQEGWASLEEVIEGIQRAVPEFKSLTTQNVINAVNTAEKIRHEIEEGKIRALYGHSTSEKITKTDSNSIVPPILYHGTTEQAWASIKQEGLKPNGRQYVHLSLNTELAKLVGKRRTKNPVILEIDTNKAKEESVSFYREKNDVWLSNNIPSKCIKIISV